MMVTQGLTILAAAIVGAAAPGQSSHQAQLGVTATVVRPAEIMVISSRMGGAVALIRNSGAIEVVAGGGAVRQLDGETTVVTSDGAGSVTITLLF